MGWGCAFRDPHIIEASEAAAPLIVAGAGDADGPAAA